MPDMISPLTGLEGATTLTTGDNRLSLGNRAPPFILQVAGWDDFETAIQPLIASLGFERIGDCSTVQTSGASYLVRLAPDRIWLLSNEAIEPDADLMSTDRLTTLDVTHGRWIIDISGSALEDLLARLAPIDSRERHMPAGSFAQTAIHKTSVLIWRRSGDHAEIFCPTSSTYSLWSFITDTAGPLGYRVAE
jgi:heterotetrameric sarcosine oxidase gamma subunit